MRDSFAPLSATRSTVSGLDYYAIDDDVTTPSETYSNYDFGLDVLGAEYEVTLSPRGVSARVGGIPPWLAIVAGAATTIGAAYVLGRSRK